MHLVHPRAWPSHGSYLFRGSPWGRAGALRVRLLPTGTRTMALKPPFSSLHFCSEPSEPETSSRCCPLHGIPYPWVSGGNTVDILTWLFLYLATPFLGDALVGRRLREATPSRGDAFARRRLSLGDAFARRCLSWAMPQAVNLLTFVPFFGALERSHHVLTLTLTFGQRPGTVHKPPSLELITCFQPKD